MKLFFKKFMGWFFFVDFHSVKNFLFSSAKPRVSDGMLGTGLPVSMLHNENSNREVPF